MLPADRRPVLGRDDQSSDTVVDVITEEQLLRGMESLTPTEPSANGGGSGGDGADAEAGTAIARRRGAAAALVCGRLRGSHDVGASRTPRGVA